MTVYRIQSKQDKKRGAYTSHTSISCCLDMVNIMAAKHTGCITHPSPSNDIGISRYVMSDEFCGFDSAVKLLRWFRGFIPDLIRTGYEIVALSNVEITATGEYQVLFKWNE